MAHSTFNKCVPSSATLAPEWCQAGHILWNKWIEGGKINDRQLKRTLICFIKEMKTRLYHFDVHPLSSEIDLADANTRIATVHLAYVSNANYSTLSMAEHRAAAANYIFAAWKLTKKIFDEDHPCSRAIWTEFENVSRH
mmetsp:Transcript_8138/g.9490  ORF Transcript_8138/g.9490 Transcript_8138/m.9490 type:complete len:139 (+) Transcript_8138:318-734(+)